MFVLIWRYTVPPPGRTEFVDAYGEAGIWARLFAGKDGFIRTELVQDSDDPQTFMTLDFWETREAFSAFQKEHGSSYREIDAMCENLTESERFVGAFEMTGSADAGDFYGAAG